MRRALGVLALLAVGAGPAVAGDAVVVLSETRTPEAPGPARGSRKPPPVRHVAILKNAGNERITGLRVTVELHDYFGKLLWARTLAPAPSSLAPGETATLSLATPGLEAYRKTHYRFEYRIDRPRRPTPRGGDVPSGKARPTAARATSF
jgi:hypothetical protein